MLSAEKKNSSWFAWTQAMRMLQDRTWHVRIYVFCRKETGNEKEYYEQQ